MAMVTIRSTRSPALSVPPTARSSATVTDTARRSGPDGSYFWPGSRIEKPWPALVDASRLRVTSWPALIVTPLMRPRTSSTRVNAAALVGSAGTERVATSPSSMGLRLAMSRTATTTLRISTAFVSVRFANRSATNTTPPTMSAITTPTAM